jgi:outer membrane protein OmpA-like peptidoglycan-associated protein
MEFIMQNHRYFLITLFAVAIVSGCATTTPKNSSLTEAHNSFNNARTNPDVTNLAALELKTADDTLRKADAALEEGEDDDTVNQLAYLAKQRVAVAEETAKQKAAELAIENANAKRTQVQLQVRTEEADTAKQALKELHARQTERGLMMTLSDVLFRTNKAKLESGGLRIVEKLADFLKQHQKYKVSIEGHTDSTGSDGYNQELSERRAEAVQLALIEMGVGSERVMAQGYGESFPVASNGTVAGRRLNRRVEIILSDEKGNIVPR